MRRLMSELIGLLVDDLGLGAGVLAAVGLTYALTREAAAGPSILGGITLVVAVAAALAVSLRRARRHHVPAPNPDELAGR